MRIGGVSSKDNTADILTKPLQPELHTRHIAPLFPNRDNNTLTQPLNPQASPEAHVQTTQDLHNMVTHIHYDNPPPLPPTSRQAHHNPALLRDVIITVVI
jgi:hypothetical protein